MGYLDHNPVDAIPHIHVDRAQPRILSVEEAKKCLEFARTRKRRFLPYLVLSMMVGVRPYEIDRMTWDMIDLRRRLIRLPAEITKDRRPRLIYPLPAAVAWLRMGGDLPLPAITKRRALRRLRKILGFEAWPQDCFRHTAASYLVAHYQDAGRVALELGNSADVLLTHYRELVTKADAKRFWSVKP